MESLETSERMLENLKGLWYRFFKFQENSRNIWKFLEMSWQI